MSYFFYNKKKIISISSLLFKFEKFYLYFYLKNKYILPLFYFNSFLIISILNYRIFKELIIF